MIRAGKFRKSLVVSRHAGGAAHLRHHRWPWQAPSSRRRLPNKPRRVARDPGGKDAPLEGEFNPQDAAKHASFLI